MTIATPRRRIPLYNPNHNIWNNHGTWFLHCTVYPTPITKERVRRSLGTTDVEVARVRRDQWLKQLSCLAPDEFQRAMAA